MQGVWLGGSSKGKTSVVFVHGILSSGATAWRNENNANWPDLLQAEPDFGDLGIYIYSYQTGVFSGTYSLNDVVDDFKERMRLDGVLNSERIIFVCHSMGGLAVRQYIVDREADLTGRNIEIGLYLVASPSLGSEYGRKFLRLARHLKQLQAQALSFSQDNTWLISLDTRFRNLLGSKRLRITGKELVEDKSIAFRWLLMKQVVEPFSAARYFSEALKITESDHFSIVKPADKTALQHRLLCELIRDMRARATAPAAAPAAVIGPSRDSASTVFGAPGAGVALQLGQVAIIQSAGMPQSSASQVQTPIGAQLLAVMSGRSQWVQTAQPRPWFEELFEVISEPAEVPRAFFGTDAPSNLVPYEGEYVKERDGVPDTQNALRDALNRAGGRLLVVGRGGIGKTREVAQLARIMCALKWKVCLARVRRDAQLSADAEMPVELVDSRLLVVIDNLQARVLATAHDAVPYMKRLSDFLARLSQLNPADELSVIVMSRDEPRYERALGFGAADTTWRGFTRYQLPEFTLAGLTRILRGLALRAKVDLADDDAEKLVENSDRKPETLFINVSLAMSNQSGLTRDVWLPTEGASWREKYVAASARFALATPVFEALRQLEAAGLPTRVEYVTALCGAGDAAASARAIDGLLDEGLLGRRRNLLIAFSAEQLEDEQPGDGSSTAEQLAPIRRMLEIHTEAHRESLDDLVMLASAYLRADHTAEVLEITDLAIRRGLDSVRVHLMRGGARFLSGDMQGAEQELDEAAQRDPKEPLTFQLRGTARAMLGKFALSIDDSRRAIELGRDEATLHAQLGIGLYQLGRLREAVETFDIAFDKGERSAMLYFLRASARLQLRDYPGVDADLSAALERGGLDLEPGLDMLNSLGAGQAHRGLRELESVLARPKGRDNALLFGLRAVARVNSGLFAEGEADATAAIDDDFSGRLVRITQQMSDTRLLKPTIDPVKAAQMNQFVHQGGAMHLLRAQARVAQGKFKEGQEDLGVAAERGALAHELHASRGFLHARMNQWAEAEREFTRAVELMPENAFYRARRGEVYLASGQHAAAEGDFDAAFRLGLSDGSAYLSRAQARLLLRRPGEAEADITTAIDMGMKTHRAYLFRAATLLELERPAEAEKDCDAALAGGAEATQIYGLRGAARLAQGNLAGADEDLAEAFRLGRGDFLVFRWRGLLRAQQHRIAEADADFTQALERGDNLALIPYVRGLARAELGRNDEALVDLDEAQKRGIDSVDLYSNRGDAHFSLEHYAEAAADFTAAITRGLDTHQVYYFRGRCRMYRRDFLGANEDFTVCMARGSNDPRVWIQRATALRELGRLTESAHDLDEAVARDAQEPSAYFERSRTHLFQGKLADAEKDATAALAHLNGAKAEIRAALLTLRGISRYGQADFAGALADFEAALEITPNDVELHGYRAGVLITLDREESAAPDFKLLNEADPPLPSVAVYEGMRSLLHQDFGEALARFRAARAASKDSEGRSWSGIAELLLGNYAAAKEDYEFFTTAALPGDTSVAMMEMDWWLKRFASSVRAQEAQETVKQIRRGLEQRLEAAG